MEGQAAMMAMVGACFLALLFLRSVLHKLGSYAEYLGNVRDYRMLPEVLVPVAARALLALEALVVAGLVLPPTRPVAAATAVLLLLAYAVAMAWNLAQGRTTIDCGCGGGGQGISNLHVLRNLLLALFALPAIAWSQAPFAGSGAFLGAAGCVLVLWLTFLAFDQLLGNHAHERASTYSRL